MEHVLGGIAAIIIIGIILSFGITMFINMSTMFACEDLHGLASGSSRSPFVSPDRSANNLNTDPGTWARACLDAQAQTQTAMVLITTVLLILGAIVFIGIIRAVM